MKKNFWRLLAALIVVSLALAACGGANPAKVYCPVNPAALSPDQRVCRPNDGKGPTVNKEVETDALAIGTQQRAIYYGYGEDEKPMLFDDAGYHPYPANRAIILPLQVQDFRTDSNPDGEFCAGQKPRCIAPIGGVTIEYRSPDGQTRVVNDVTISVVGSLRFIVDENTASAWLMLDRSRTQEDYWFKFWDQVRVPKLISIVSTGVDPVADQWGERTNLAVAQILTARATSWDFSSLYELTDGTITVKSVEAPILPGTTGNTNVDAQATQNAIELEEARAYATQRAVICEGITDEVACAWQMQNYTGNGNSPVTVQTNPNIPATPEPTSIPNP